MAPDRRQTDRSLASFAHSTQTEQADHPSNASNQKKYHQEIVSQASAWIQENHNKTPWWRDQMGQR